MSMDQGGGVYEVGESVLELKCVRRVLEDVEGST